MIYFRWCELCDSDQSLRMGYSFTNHKVGVSRPRWHFSTQKNWKCLWDGTLVKEVAGKAQDDLRAIPMWSFCADFGFSFNPSGNFEWYFSIKINNQLKHLQKYEVVFFIGNVLKIFCDVSEQGLNLALLLLNLIYSNQTHNLNKFLPYKIFAHFQITLENISID